MATYTSNYAWTKPSGNDQVDISVLNDNLDSQDAIMHKAFTNMAQAFSELSTYAVGDIVLYDNELYKCHTAVTVAGAWTGSTNWQVYKLSEGGGGGTSNYNDLTNKPSINNVTLSGNKTTSDLGINADNVMMSDGVTNVEEALDEVKSGLTNLGSATDLGNVQGSDTITLSNAVSNYRFIQIRIGYYGSGYPCFGQALLPVSTLYISPDNTATSIAFSAENINGRVDISFLSATSVKVVNTSGTLYTKVVGIA